MLVNKNFKKFWSAIHAVPMLAQTIWTYCRVLINECFILCLRESLHQVALEQVQQLVYSQTN
jgi:hypothetical protein